MGGANLVVQLHLPHHSLHERLPHRLRLLRLHGEDNLRPGERVPDQIHGVGFDAFQVRQETLVRRLDPSTSVEVELERLQLRIVAQMPQDGNERFVVDESPVLVAHRVGVETWGGVFELEAQVSDHGGVGWPDGLEEFAYTLVS